MDMNIIKQQLKEFAVKKASEKAFSRRVENICRSAINRWSYELKQDQTSTFLVKGDRIIYIEKNPDIIYGDGTGYPVFKRVFRDAVVILAECKTLFASLCVREIKIPEETKVEVSHEIVCSG